MGRDAIFWSFVKKHIDNVINDKDDSLDWQWDGSSTRKEDDAISYLYSEKKSDKRLTGVRNKLNMLKESRTERRQRENGIRKIESKKLKLKASDDNFNKGFDELHKTQILQNNGIENTIVGKNGCFVCGSLVVPKKTPCSACLDFFERWVIRYCNSCSTIEFLSNDDYVKDTALVALASGLTYPIIKTACKECGGNILFELKYQKYESGLVDILEVKI